MAGKKLFFEGMIIHSSDYGESHKIIQVLTKSSGAISLMVYGARNYKNLFRGKVEIFNHAEFSAHFSGRSKMLVLEEVKVLNSFSSLLGYDKIWILFPFLKFLSLFYFETEQENEKIFLMLIKLFETFKDCSTLKQVRFLVFAFVLKSLSITSMIGDLRLCESCLSLHQYKVYERKDSFLLFCSECAQDKELYKEFSWDFFSFLVKIIYSRFEEMLYFIIDDKILDKIRDFISKICIQSLGRKWSDFELHDNPFNLES